MAPARRRASTGAVAAGFATAASLCLFPTYRIHSYAFSSNVAGSGRHAGGNGRGTGVATSRSAIRSRASGRTRSAVDGEEQRVGAHQTHPLDRTDPELELDPELTLFGATTTRAVLADVSDESVSRSLASSAAGAAGLAIADAGGAHGGLSATKVMRDGRKRLVSPKGTEQWRRQSRKGQGGKDPEVVDGDNLANTPKMIALVWSSLALNAVYLLQAFSTVASPAEAAGMAGAGAFVGYVISDLFSGLLHWSLDNYGSRGTPAFGAIIESFQGHHASPWTITHRPFENNVHKVTYAALPLLLLLRLADPGLFGVALGVAFLFGSLMSNEFHKYSHMIDPPPVAKALQGLGLSISRKQHGRHHSGTFDEKYCLVSGICNGPLDHFRVFRFLERVVYQVKGVEPVAWRLDPCLKEVSLSTGWLPFAARRDEGANEHAKTDSG